MGQIKQSPAGEITSQPVSIGKRVARMRQALGLTQQALAERLAISRVAISHIEMDLSIPSERTITLLAGLFKLTPDALVSGTTYPEGKAERLPLVVCCYTPLELELALLDNDIEWLGVLNRLAKFEIENIQLQVWDKWCHRLDAWYRDSFDEREKESIITAQQRLAAACSPTE